MKPKVGDKVLLTGDLGDFNALEKRHVTVPKGTKATVIEVIREGLTEYARLSIPDSPGQKTLRTSFQEFDRFWEPERPSQWERLLEESDG